MGSTPGSAALVTQLGGTWRCSAPPACSWKNNANGLLHHTRSGQHCSWGGIAHRAALLLTTRDGVGLPWHIRTL